MDRVCPLLGLAAERGVAIDGVDAAHRCHAEDPPAALERTMQAQLCLTQSHVRCERYLAFAGRTGAATPGRTRLGEGLVTTRLVLAPQPAWRGMAGRARSARAAPWVAAAAVVATAGVAGAAFAAPLLTEPDPEPRAGVGGITFGPSASATVEPLPTRDNTPTPMPTATLAPSSPSPTAPLTPAPTEAPTQAPTPLPQRTYTVVEGDTLAAIAERFGTSAAALQEANGLEDPDEIVIGQVLVIP